MSNDEHFEHQQEPWGVRLWRSIKGMGIGFLLFVGSFYFIYWNEGRCLQTYRSLEEGLGDVVSISATEIHDNNNGKLVHLTGIATSKREIFDESFKLTVNALRLSRRVEMYQWEEIEVGSNKPSTGKKKRARFRYRKVWSEELIDSDDFHGLMNERVNPKELPFEPKSWTTEAVRLGAFSVPPDLLSDVESWTDVELTKQNIPQSVPHPPESKVSDGSIHIDDGAVYIGRDPKDPQIGDARVWFEKVPAIEVTFVGAQNGESLQEYQTEAGDELIMLKPGKLNASEMFDKAESHNSEVLWVFRILGVATTIVGLKFLIEPISAALGFLPFLGGIIRLGVDRVSVVAGGSLAVFTIGTAWVSYHPMIGLPLIVIPIVALVVLAKKRVRKADEKETGPEAAESPTTESESESPTTESVGRQETAIPSTTDQPRDSSSPASEASSSGSESPPFPRDQPSDVQEE